MITLIVLFTALVWLSNQHQVLTPVSSCDEADKCTHTWLPICAQDNHDASNRLFVDECDMHEYNCDNNSTFIKVEVKACAQKCTKRSIETTLVTRRRKKRKKTTTTTTTTTTEETITQHIVSSEESEYYYYTSDEESTTEEPSTSVVTTLDTESTPTNTKIIMDSTLSEAVNTEMTATDTKITTMGNETTLADVNTTVDTTELSSADIENSETNTDASILATETTFADNKTSDEEYKASTAINGTTQMDITSQKTEMAEPETEIYEEIETVEPETTSVNLETNISDTETTVVGNTEALSADIETNEISTTEVDSEESTSTTTTTNTKEGIINDGSTTKTKPCYPKGCFVPSTWETTGTNEYRDFYQILRKRFGDKVKILRATTHFPKSTFIVERDNDIFVPRHRRNSGLFIKRR